jgi:hypothetical protein
MNLVKRLPLMAIAMAMVLLPFTVQCGGDDSSKSGADLGGSCTGGPVTGAQDAHCVGDGGNQFIAVDKAQCTVDAGDGNGDGGGAGDFGASMYNTSGYDDDCKYFVSFAVAPICENQNTFFIVTLKDAPQMQPVAGATTVRPEVFLSDTHPANVSKATTTETSPGVYKIGPVQFDASGQWTVRFHFFENCTDIPTSPHGHAAFYVNVP